ncbi:abasic site processing protein HMCES isoform X2 [Brachyhypopomus gauderio]|uniref:abasic site processing protein HMCES isoform X2 n=1 Tax=Brachyhypopomus gauderio TaxID=698409 RepID=UPI0040435277
MCGRTACTLAPNELRCASRYQNRTGHRQRPKWRDGDADKYRPSYNKSPQSFSPVLLSNRHFNKDAPVDECVLATMRWGLVPAWFKESDPSKMQYSTSNCRSENLLEKKSYKSQGAPGPSQQCTQGGHNTLSVSQGGREDDDESSEWAGWRLLTIAGLFDCWSPPGGGEVLYTYTVITVDASENIQNIHDRMPAILEGEEEVRRWLDFGEVRSLEALKLLKSKSCLTFHPVSSLVNNSRNNSPECLQPLDPALKKTPQASASSKMLMSWLKSGSPRKRKEPDDDTMGTEENTPSEKQAKPIGPLQQWLLGHGVCKKPRT